MTAPWLASGCKPSILPKAPTFAARSFRAATEALGLAVCCSGTADGLKGVDVVAAAAWLSAVQPIDHRDVVEAHVVRHRAAADGGIGHAAVSPRGAFVL